MSSNLLFPCAWTRTINYKWIIRFQISVVLNIYVPFVNIPPTLPVFCVLVHHSHWTPCGVSNFVDLFLHWTMHMHMPIPIPITYHLKCAHFSIKSCCRPMRNNSVFLISVQFECHINNLSDKPCPCMFRRVSHFSNLESTFRITSNSKAYSFSCLLILTIPNQLKHRFYNEINSFELFFKTRHRFVRKHFF